MKKTKIICTIGPATSSVPVIKRLINEGMNVARLNMSHGTHESHAEYIKNIRLARESESRAVGIMIDTKGPEIRIKQFEKGGVCLETGRMFVLTTMDVIGNESMVSVTYKNLPSILKVGSKILLSDGFIELKVKSLTKYDVICKVVEGGELTNNKSISLCGVDFDMEYLSDTDKEDLLFAIKNNVEFVAISFVKSRDDVDTVRRFLKANGGDDILIVSKIENAKGVENIDSIIDASDGIMVARGDMGVEVSFKKLPAIQKNIVKKCILKGKISIIATQMLESMIHLPRPTRAEISDVANAVIDGSSALMLSGETAVGRYPVQTVKTMCEIIKETEKETDYFALFRLNSPVKKNISTSVAHATCALSFSLGTKAIVVVTSSGNTAKLVSGFRPGCHIIACTPSVKVYNQLSLYFGVTSVIQPYENSTDKLLAGAKECAVLTNLLKRGDVIVQTTGVPAFKNGETNQIRVDTIS